GKTIAALERWREAGKEEKISRIALWGVAAMKGRATLSEDHGAGLLFSPHGKMLVASTLVYESNPWPGSKVRRWDAATGKDLPALPMPPEIKAPSNALAFSPDGATLAGADYEGTIVVWDVAKGEVRATLVQEEKRRIASLAFSPDGKTLAAAVGDRP